MDRIQELMTQGNFFAASQVAMEIYPSHHQDIQICATVIVALSNAGFYDEAVEIVRQTPDVLKVPGIFMPFIDGCITIGCWDVVEAFDILNIPIDELNESEFRNTAWNAINAALYDRAQVQSKVQHEDKFCEIASRCIHSKSVSKFAACIRSLRRSNGTQANEFKHGLLDNTTTPEWVKTIIRQDDFRTQKDFEYYNMLHNPNQDYETYFPSVFEVPSVTNCSSAYNYSLTEALPPKVSQSFLETNIAQWIQDIRSEIKNRPDLKHICDRVSHQNLSPISVISTGRVGTMALKQFCDHSSKLQPIHYLQHHILSQDLNAILYRLLRAPNPNEKRLIREELVHIAMQYLEDRIAEFVTCYSIGKRPIVLNHLDSIFSPVIKGAFSETRIIYLYRNATKTLLSLAYKNQFNYRQLRHLLYHFEDNIFFSRRDRSLGHENEVAWYMAITETLADTMENLSPPNDFRRIDMEQVFNLNSIALDEMCEAFYAEAIRENAVEVFSEPINEKSHYTISQDVLNRHRDNSIAEDLVLNFKHSWQSLES